LKAAVASAGLVRQSHWRGELLDGAALAAQELGRSDLSTRLETAWRAAPTPTRLLRWLAADHSGCDVIHARAAKAVARGPKTALRQRGLLRALRGDVSGAAALLSKAPGLGWSDPDHPGHTLFPLFATLLSRGDIDSALLNELDATAGDPIDCLVVADEGPAPKLTTPSVSR
jgi:hypothetical protein